MYDSQDHMTAKIPHSNACVSNNNYQIKRRMKDVKSDEESDRPVFLTRLNTIRNSTYIPSHTQEVQNRNALSPASCMMQEAEQRSTLSICTNEDQPAAQVQVNALKNSTTTSASTSSPPQVACLDEGLTAAAQPNIAACRSTLTLGKGLFLHRVKCFRTLYHYVISLASYHFRIKRNGLLYFT